MARNVQLPIPHRLAAENRFRWRLPLTVGIIVCALAALAVANRPAFSIVMQAFGVRTGVVPFLDWVYIPASIDCWAKGIDVYQANPCDPLGRPMDYSPLWLRLSFLPRAQPWITVSAVLVDLAFILSLALLPPIRSPRQFIALAFAACSSFSLLGLERGNIDLLMFALVLVAAASAGRASGGRNWAYASIGLAAALKFYPLLGLALLANERRRRFFAIALVFAAIIVAFIVGFRIELVAAIRNVPTGSYLSGGFYGAKNLPQGFAEIAAYLLGGPHSGGWAAALSAIARPRSPAATAIVAVLALVSLGASLRAARRWRFLSLVRLLPEAEATSLLAGAAIVAGCFFAGQCIDYRGVFLILPLPGLFALAAQASTPAQHRLFKALIFLIPVLMWEPALDLVLRGIVHDGPRHGPAYIVLWLVREAAWWTMVTLLDALLICLLAESAILADLLPAWHAGGLAKSLFPDGFAGGDQRT